MTENFEGRRVTVKRFCDCESDGWGCCCARPARSVMDEEGDYVLVSVDAYKVWIDPHET